MASGKEYLHFILEQLSDLEEINYRAISYIIGAGLPEAYMMTGYL